MKTAEDLVLDKATCRLSDLILSLMNIPTTYDKRNGIPKGSYDAVLLEIAQALTAYAEERVRHAVVESFGPEYRKVRAETLEEASKVALCMPCGDGDCDYYLRIAERIRALKAHGCLQ